MHRGGQCRFIGSVVCIMSHYVDPGLSIPRRDQDHPFHEVRLASF